MKCLSVVLAPVLLLLIPKLSVAQNTVTDWNAIGITAARASTAPGSATAGGTGIYMAYMHLAVYNASTHSMGDSNPTSTR